VHEWIRCEADETAIAAGCKFDLAAAVRVRNFCKEFLRHSKGQWAGKPFELLDWEWFDVIGPLFGWKRADGTRRFRQAYIEIPKKNGKSSLMSAVELYLLVGDDEQGAEVYTAAADRDQAGIVYDEAARMVDASPELAKHLQVIRSTKRIIYPRSNSVLRALSADVPTKEGLNASAVIFDELHAQRGRELWDTLYYAGIARRQPLLISITTAGYDRQSICYEQRGYAEQVRDGLIEDMSFLPVIYRAGEDDDWTDPAVWIRANPSLGAMLDLEEFHHACNEAKVSPRKENTFKRYRLNIWTEQDVRWLSIDAWNACDKPLDIESLKGRECWAGLDLSTKVDLSALVLAFPLEGREFALVPFLWIPHDNAHNREKRDRVPYLQWARDGFLALTEGNVIDYEAIEAKICELAGQYQIREIAFDPWNAQATANRLANEGLNMVEFRQGFVSMSGPTKDFEALVLSRRLIHGGHPVLKWNAGNVAVQEDAAGNIKPNKKKSTERIDGIVAAIMATGRAMISTEDNSGSVYEERGLLTL